MTRQLSTMVSSGMSLLRALYVLEDQAESDKLKETLVAVRKDVEAGISLSDALAKHPETFNDLYVAMVAAGETGGILESTLRRVADQLEKDEELRRQVKSAMVYPSLIGGFALLVLVALVAFLVPVFAGVFEDFGGELPAITEVHRRALRLHHEQVVHGHRDRLGRRLRLPQVEADRDRAGCSGTSSS